MSFDFLVFQKKIVIVLAYFCNASTQRQVCNLLFNGSYLIDYLIFQFCMILIACCLCLPFKNMGILTKWGDLMDFLDVY
jgi:hypothetical protein